MSKVREFVNHLLDMQDLSELQEKDKLRISVSLEDYNARRLEHCAKRLGMTRAGLASEILSRSISEVEEALGLEIHVNDGSGLSEYGKQVFGSAGEEVEQ